MFVLICCRQRAHMLLYGVIVSSMWASDGGQCNANADLSNMPLIRNFLLSNSCAIIGSVSN